MIRKGTLIIFSGLPGSGKSTLAMKLASANLRLGNLVIADSVNPEDFTRAEWNAVATEVDANFINIEVFCSDKNEHKFRIENRGSVPGAEPVTWNDVLNRAYHRWTDERIAIDTAGKSIDECAGGLLRAVENQLKTLNSKVHGSNFA